MDLILQANPAVGKTPPLDSAGAVGGNGTQNATITFTFEEQVFLIGFCLRFLGSDIKFHE
jgi:hypothetical protein